jgi:hypothetical protein
MCPKSSEKLIAYIEKRAREDEPLPHVLSQDEPRRTALLAKCPESNLRCLASLAAAAQVNVKRTSSSSSLEDTFASFHGFSSLVPEDDAAPVFGKQFHGLESMVFEMYQNQNSFSANESDIQLKSGDAEETLEHVVINTVSENPDHLNAALPVSGENSPQGEMLTVKAIPSSPGIAWRKHEGEVRQATKRKLTIVMDTDADEGLENSAKSSKQMARNDGEGEHKKICLATEINSPSKKFSEIYP